jgi:hypothetical protein
MRNSYKKRKPVNLAVDTFVIFCIKGADKYECLQVNVSNCLDYYNTIIKVANGGFSGIIFPLGSKIGKDYSPTRQGQVN